MKVLYFSRGRGHGHAIQDLAITKEWKRMANDLDVEFASYGTGLTTFREAGTTAHDLRLPEDNAFLPTLAIAHETIANVRPTLVVAREEFAVLPAAAWQGIPAAFVSEWLPPHGSIAAEALAFAQAIIIEGEPGLFPPPPGVATPPQYVGPVVRQMKFTASDRAALRSAEGIPEDAVVLLVVPGGWATEDRAPIASIVLSAFIRLRHSAKRLYWLAGTDFEAVRQLLEGIDGAHVVTFVHPVERMIALADVVITKATRGITVDAATVGVPTISLSYGLNPIDELLIPRMRSNVALNARAVDGEVLHFHIELLLRRKSPSSTSLPAAENLNGIRTAAALFRDSQHVLHAGNGQDCGRGAPAHDESPAEVMLPGAR